MQTLLKVIKKTSMFYRLIVPRDYTKDYSGEIIPPQEEETLGAQKCWRVSLAMRCKRFCRYLPL